MPRIPPNLLYLTIYNPTLQPTGPVDDDDEDAEEQAHILFYTSKERAVSRDRMLRQVGLAKALVSFSEMFNPTEACDNVHSQSKRMIMISPEPKFWMHAAVEVAKVPRVPAADKGRGKAGVKARVVDKGKEKEEAAVVYDGIEGSVHDLALRRTILKGYEQFKLTHGSFTSILSTLGQEALELQLERFFTVWAWSWDLEEKQEFRDHLELPNAPSPVLIIPPYVAPSTQYTTADYASSLSRHLLSLVPPPVSLRDNRRPSHDRDATITPRSTAEISALNGKDPPKTATASSFMDVTKWNWTGYISFGRGTATKSPMSENKPIPASFENPPTDDVGGGSVGKEDPGEEDLGKEGTTKDDVGTVSPQGGEVDKKALEDAISEYIPLPSPVMSSADAGDVSAVPALNGVADPPAPVREGGSPETEGSHTRIPSDIPATDLPVDVEAPAPPTPPPSRFSSTNVHLAESNNPLSTVKRKVFYHLKGQMMLALVGLDEEHVISNPELTQRTATLLDQIRGVIEVEAAQLLSDSLPSAAKVLQAPDSHIVNVGNFTVSSPGFNSKSAHLFEAQEIQSKDPDISEVFSRGQNPQHWHIARRNLGGTEDGAPDQEVYMGIYRKEASLGEVDNVLASAVRKSGIMDGAL